MKALIEVKGHVEILGETPLAAVLFMVIQADGTAAVECAGDGELLFRGLGKLAASLIDERLDQLEEDDRELTP